MRTPQFGKKSKSANRKSKRSKAQPVNASEQMRAATNQSKGAHRNLEVELQALSALAKQEGVEAALRASADLIQQWRDKVGKDRIPTKLLYNVGLMALRAGKLDTAKASFMHTLTIWPEHHSSMAALSDIHFRQGDFQKSEHYIRQAVKCDPLPRYAFMLSNTMFAAGKNADVCTFLEHEVSEILKVPEPSNRQLSTIALYLAATSNHRRVDVHDHFQQNNNFIKPDTAFEYIARAIKTLNDIRPGKYDFIAASAQAIDKQLTSRDKASARRAALIIKAYGGSRVWEDMHSRTAASQTVAEAIGTYGQATRFRRIKPKGDPKSTP